MHSKTVIHPPFFLPCLVHLHAAHILKCSAFILQKITFYFTLNKGFNKPLYTLIGYKRLNNPLVPLGSVYLCTILSRLSAQHDQKGHKNELSITATAAANRIGCITPIQTGITNKITRKEQKI